MSARVVKIKPQSIQKPNVSARLMARPRVRTGDGLKSGLQPLGLSDRRDGLLYLPSDYRSERVYSLVLMLHGAGSNSFHGLSPLMSLADAAGIVLLAPESRGPTWDLIVRDYGPDLDFIDQALEYVFEKVAIDRDRIAIEGFSDGASYALSLGISNGDLFTHIMAFSPGFMAPGSQEGSPRIFISHGTDDQVLRIDHTSRRIVPRLEQVGYEVDYREFAGGHTVSLEIGRQAIDWFESSVAAVQQRVLKGR